MSKAGWSTWWFRNGRATEVARSIDHGAVLDGGPLWLDHATQRQILLLPPSSEPPEKTQQDTPALLLSSQTAGEATQTTISYTYDSLYRLTDAVYSNGFEFHYTYDAVGNRLTQTTCAPGVPCGTTHYQYDDANRLIAVDGVAYTWDDNGNLLNDSASTYGYDTQNRLISLTQGGHNYTFSYNGQGDRLTQSVDGATTRYMLDLEAGLTQVLSDGTTAYLYGADRLAQVSDSETDYFLGDTLGSVRQLVDAGGAVRLAKNYEPYGRVMGSAGSSASAYGFAGESQSGGLVYLRTRFYDSSQGRFSSRDSWKGDDHKPASYDGWLFVYADPVNHQDPSGQCLEWQQDVGYVENHRPPEGQPCLLYEWSRTQSLSNPTCDTAFSTWPYPSPISAPNHSACESQDWETGVFSYHRDFVTQYAQQYPDGTYNPVYGAFTRGEGADCTSFVSQALQAGGLPMTADWYFDTAALIQGYAGRCDQEGSIFAGILRPVCAQSWPWPTGLRKVLTEKYGFQIGTIVLGARDLYRYVDVQSEIQPNVSIAVGDVVFYYQDQPVSSTTPNHAAIVVRWAPPSRKGITQEGGLMPWIADHTGPGYQRAFNDITQIQQDDQVKVEFVHIPSQIRVRNPQEIIKRCDRYWPISQPLH